MNMKYLHLRSNLILTKKENAQLSGNEFNEASRIDF